MSDTHDEDRVLVARVYAKIKTDKLTALAARFRQAQAATRQARADADYRWENPRRRADMVNAAERFGKAESEMLAAFAALVAECKELDAKNKE